MSLLLEALKKAELAKQSSLGSAPPFDDSSSGGISFEEPAEPMIRRDPKPELGTPMPERAAARSTPPVPQPEAIVPEPRAPRPAPLPEPDGVSPPIPDPQRAAARQLFDVKEVDYNPKRPFYITLGMLGLAAAGYGGYLWWQLQPRYTVNTATVQNAPKSAPIARAPSVAPPPPDAATAAAPATATPEPESAPTPATKPAVTPADPRPAASATAKPAAGPTAPAVAPPVATVNPASTTTASAPTPSNFLRQGQAAPPPQAASTSSGSANPAPPRVAAPRPQRLPIKITPPAFQANETLERAYAAFQRGEFDRARVDYQQVLARETNSRDALLGLAAIDVRTRDYATAELRYLKLLELDPRDAHAHAALIALQGNVDPVQSESRVKNLIAAQPDATHLYFTLGNQYAAQARWAEAQDAYFKAFSAEPDNADFAFNLAVSLDHLRQRRLASEYYRKATFLAGTRPVGFDRKQAESRARDLER